MGLAIDRSDGVVNNGSPHGPRGLFAEGTVDGTHPNDRGMMHMSKAFGGAVKQTLNL